MAELSSQRTMRMSLFPYMQSTSYTIHSYKTKPFKPICLKILLINHILYDRFTIWWIVETLGSIFIPTSCFKIMKVILSIRPRKRNWSRFSWHKSRLGGPITFIKKTTKHGLCSETMKMKKMNTVNIVLPIPDTTPNTQLTLFYLDLIYS